MIRPVSLLDLEGLAALHADCFPEGQWSADTFAQLLFSPHCLGLVATASYGSFEAPCGFVIVRTVADEAEILTIGVASSHRRAGFGKALVEAACVRSKAAGADALYLEAGADNEAALTLYRRLGFRAVGRRIAYYQRRGGAVDAVLLRRDLVQPAPVPGGSIEGA